jgi:hypothetical protein
MPGAKEGAQGRDLTLALEPQDRGNPLAWTGSHPTMAPVLLLESCSQAAVTKGMPGAPEGTQGPLGVETSGS